MGYKRLLVKEMTRHLHNTNTPLWRDLEKDIIKLQVELFNLQKESSELGEKLGRNKANTAIVEQENLSSSLSLSQLASIKCSLIEAIYDIKFMISFRKTLLEQKKTS